MARTNGHAPEDGGAELDALLVGLFEPTLYEVAPGRTVEIHPLTLGQADALYAGGLSGAGLQRFLLSRCIHVGGKPIGEAGAGRLPVTLANRLAPLVMEANGMATEAGDDGQGAAAADPLS